MKYLVDSFRVLSMLSVFLAGFFGYHAYLYDRTWWLLGAVGGGGFACAYLFWLAADFWEPLPPKTIEEEWF